jgi:pyrrolidone-carboxylate peptidase
MFETEFERTKPDVILGLGQHPRARKIRNERVARDAQGEDARTPKPISGDGDLRMSLEIPEHELLTTTYNAGAYVCNFSMYVAEEYMRKKGGQAAFLHIPRKIDLEQATQYLEELLLRLSKL